jgi:replicative DNA helicase
MADFENIEQQSNRLKTIRNAPSSEQMFGRVQPQARDLEQAILGAIMLDKEALPSIIEILRADTFYDPPHKFIYEVMEDLFEKMVPIDMLTVHEALNKNGNLDKVGGINYLMDLTNRVASSANIEYHARIVVQKYIQRELIRLSAEVTKEAFEDSKDVLELLDFAEQSLYNITDQNLNTGYEQIRAVAAKVQKHIEEISKKEDGLTGVPTGFKELDKITNGWQSSDLIIIAARPGMGKTAFTLSLAKNAAEHGFPVAIFSLEMANEQLVTRLIAMDSLIPSSVLRTGQLSEEEFKILHNSISRLSEQPIYVDDTPAINIFELRAKCRRMKQKHGIKMVVIDYLQLMTGAPGKNKGNREQEISTISRSLKALAKEMHIPVIALSQLSRAVETRGGDKRPQLSDLRESGAIEQDADIVTFIYRPDYYGLGDDDDNMHLQAAPDEAEIIISKHRNGSLGSVKLRFVKEYVKFTDLEDSGFSDLKDPFDDASQTSFITRQSKMNAEDDIFS